MFIVRTRKKFKLLVSFHVDDGNGNVTFESFAGILRFDLIIKCESKSYFGK